MHALPAKIKPDKFLQVAKMAIFASCIFSEPHAAHFRHACSHYKATSYVEVW